MNQPKIIFKKFSKEIKPNQLSYDPSIPNQTKILYIDTVENFDLFTNIYGYIDRSLLLIKWEEVAKNFKGFGLNPELFGERFFECPFHGKVEYSWWDNDYYQDGFNRFIKK